MTRHRPGFGEHVELPSPADGVPLVPVVTDEKLDLVRVDFQLLLAEVTEDSTVPFEERARADGT
jgi:hypothetical protein